jgi:hypothetical protein
MNFSHDRLKYPVNRYLIVLAAASGLFIGGCAPTGTSVDWEHAEVYDPDISRTGWSSPATSMGIVPIMPPSEDVRVGDMYVYSFNPDVASANPSKGQGVLSYSPRWGTLNLLEELEQEYQTRPDWPKTPDAYIQVADETVGQDWPEPSNPPGESIFARDSVTNRLRNFGISELSTYTLSEGDADALVPTEAINLVLGTAWNDDKILTIRMNSGETYSLGLQKVIEVALGGTGQGTTLNSPYRDNLALIADPHSDSVWIRILSDVIYIRSIDFIIQSQSGFEEDEEASADEFVSEAEETVEVVAAESGETAAEKGDEMAEGEAGDGEEGEAGEVEGDAQEEVQEEAREEVITTVTEEILEHELDPAYAAFVRANAINELLIESDSDDLPGGFMRFISITDDSVTIRRVWQRGLAVGVRGLTLEVDKFTGDVLRSGNMGSLRP